MTDAVVVPIKPLEVGNVPVIGIADTNRRLSLLLWGPSGCGKTTLAATAPGKKLWFNFDPDGTNAIANRDDILVADFSGEPPRYVERFKKEDEIGVARILKANPEVETVVVDSVTSFADNALQHGVVDASRFGASLEDPGFKGYGRKHAWVHAMVININRVTRQLNKHVIFICHEDHPTKDKEGNVLFISMLLGSSLVVELPVQLSEIWHMENVGKQQRIAIAPCRAFKPMKSRMFISTGEPEFIWKFDADKLEGEGISDWHKRWIEAGSKIPIPK